MRDFLEQPHQRVKSSYNSYKLLGGLEWAKKSRWQ
jgi:hypothetical protein